MSGGCQKKTDKLRNLMVRLKKKPQRCLHHVKSGRRGELCRQVFFGFVFCMTFSSMCLCVCVMEVEDKDQTWRWDSNLFLFTTLSSFFFFFGPFFGVAFSTLFSFPRHVRILKIYAIISKTFWYFPKIWGVYYIQGIMLGLHKMKR